MKQKKVHFDAVNETSSCIYSEKLDKKNNNFAVMIVLVGSEETGSLF